MGLCASTPEAVESERRNTYERKMTRVIDDLIHVDKADEAKVRFFSVVVRWVPGVCMVRR